MNKTIVVALVFLSALLPKMQAQKLMSLDFNPKIGVNFNDLIISESNVPTSSLAKLGWNLGLDVKYGKRIQADAGLHFFKLGTGLEIHNDTSKVTTSQFKVPMGISYKLWNVEYFNLWIHSQLVANFTTKIVQGNAYGTDRIYPRSGFSGRIGIGMDVSKITVELNYERSFTHLVRQLFDARAQLIGLAVGLKI